MIRPRTHRNVRTALASLLIPLTTSLIPLTAQQLLEAPYAAAAGDLAGDVDGDGHLDLVVVEAGLVTWPGQGDGSFGAKILSQAPGAKLPAALGDLDGDGRDDVVFRRTLAGQPTTIGVALATGGGQFGPAAHLDLPSPNNLVSAVALVDVDDDGDLDLLVGREGEQRLLGYLGDGQGGFAPGADLQGVMAPQQITSGDINGDGRLDLVVLGRLGIGGPSLVGVLFGGAGAAFSAPLMATSPVFTLAVEVADLNGDDHDDLVLLDQLNGKPPLLSTWEPHGSGFEPPVALMAVDEDLRIEAARAGDMDEDGRDDLVLLDDRGRVSVLRQAIDGSLADAVSHGVWPAATSIVLADVDENGGRDVLTTGGAATTLLTGTGQGLFGPALGLPDAPRDVAATDLDGDGREDLVSLGDTGGPLLVHVADALGGWIARDAVDAGPGGRSVEAGRFTEDDADDLLVVRGGLGSSALVLAAGTGDGTFGPPMVTPLTYPAREGWAADIDGDGLLDVLVVESVGFAPLHVVRNAGDGVFVETTVLGPFDLLRETAFADLTGDGVLDVAVASVAVNGRISVHPGVGDGTFLAPIVTDMPVPAWPENLALGDVDLDGTVDAVFSVGAGATVLLPGNGDGTFGPLVAHENLKPFDELMLTDLDRDGRLDLVGATNGTASFGTGTVYVRPGTGTTSFGPIQGVPSPGGARRLVVADPDGDGAPDVVVASHDLPQLILMHNAAGPWHDLGHSLAGSHGHSKLTGVGSLQPGTAVDLIVTHGPPRAPTTLLVGLDVLLAPFRGGILVPSPDVVVGGLLSDTAGGLVLAGRWPPGLVPGTTFVFQAWFEDAATPGGAAATTGLTGTTP